VTNELLYLWLIGILVIVNVLNFIWLVWLDANLHAIRTHIAYEKLEAIGREIDQP
jgi:hypothetical protein